MKQIYIVDFTNKDVVFFEVDVNNRIATMKELFNKSFNDQYLSSFHKHKYNIKIVNEYEVIKITEDLMAAGYNISNYKIDGYSIKYIAKIK